MDGDDASGQVEPFDATQSRRLEHRFQLFLRRMHADALGKVLITLGVTGDGGAELRQDVERIPVVGGAQRCHRARELEHQRAAAGLQHAVHLGERAILVGDVAQPEGDGHGVEAAIGKGQAFGVALCARRDDALIEQMVAPDLEHGGIDVGVQHEAVAADAPAHQANQVAGAAGEVEHALAGAQVQLSDGKALPEPMQPARHRVVHHVVALGDGIEDRAHAVLLLVLGHGLVAEVRGAGTQCLLGAGISHGSLLPVRAARGSRATVRRAAHTARADRAMRRCPSCGHR